MDNALFSIKRLKTKNETETITSFNKVKWLTKYFSTQNFFFEIFSSSIIKVKKKLLLTNDKY